MQMFEDAITRWKHSRTCKGTAIASREKDLNGQVIQLYVKPDKVSYHQNNIPGQDILKYKPHVKKDSAELKCMICQRRFLSLDDIREHVKYPCRKVYKSDSDSKQLDDIEDPTLIKIRRVELCNTDEPAVGSTGSGLSVLAEASKHIESLVPGEDTLVNSFIEKQLKGQSFEPAKVSAELPPLKGVVVIADNTRTNTNSLGVNTVSEGRLKQNHLPPPPPLSQKGKRKAPKEAKPKPIEPLLIVFQEEDGQILPVDQLDPETVQNYVRETAESAPVGQVIQVQLGVNSVQSYIKRAGGEVVPVQAITTETKFKSNLSAATTSKEVQQVSVNTPVHTETIPTYTTHPVQENTLPQGPTSSSQSIETQTAHSALGTIIRAQNLLRQTQDRPEAVLVQNTAATLQNSFVVPVQNFDYIGQVVLPTEDIKGDTVLEETIEEQGFLLPPEEQTFL